MKQPLNLDNHLELSEKISNIRSSLIEIRRSLQNKSGTSPEIKKIAAIENHIDGLRNELDNKYHRIIDDSIFKDLGHIYYGGKQHEAAR